MLRITKWLRPTSLVQTIDGEVTNEDWLRNEARRIGRDGVDTYVGPNPDGTQRTKDWLALFRADMDESAYLTHKERANDVW